MYNSELCKPNIFLYVFLYLQKKTSAVGKAQIDSTVFGVTGSEKTGVRFFSSHILKRIQEVWDFVQDK